MTRTHLVTIVFFLMLATRLAAQSAESPLAALCREAVTSSRWDDALDACEIAHRNDPDDDASLKNLARADFSSGRSSRAADLWDELIRRKGWSAEAAIGEAEALWRDGRFPQAEQLFADSVKREGGVPVRRRFAEFLMSFDRWEEAITLSRQGAEKFPSQCEFLEDWGVAEAGRGQDEEASRLIRRAIASGCPALRWSQKGPVAARLEHSKPLQSLLDPARLVEGLSSLSAMDAAARFELLRRVGGPSQANAIADAVLAIRDSHARATGLAALASFGAGALASWTRIFEREDLFLRRAALRAISVAQDPCFIGLLEQRIRLESFPRTRNMTKLALARVLLEGEDPPRGEELLREIPEDDAIFASAAQLLGRRLAARGQTAEALSWLERARGSDPLIAIDQGLIDSLCTAVMGRR